MDFQNQDFNVLGMAEAVAKVGMGKPVFILSRLYPETTVSQLAGALGFVECKEKAPAIVDERKPEPKKSGPKKKALPKAEPKELVIDDPLEKDQAQKRIDVGKIRACYLANPPRDPDWIAGEMGLTRPEVVVILKDMDIYRGD